MTGGHVAVRSPRSRSSSRKLSKLPSSSSTVALPLSLITPPRFDSCRSAASSQPISARLATLRAADALRPFRRRRWLVPTPTLGTSLPLRHRPQDVRTPRPNPQSSKDSSCRQLPAGGLLRGSVDQQSADRWISSWAPLKGTGCRAAVLLTRGSAPTAVFALCHGERDCRGGARRSHIPEIRPSGPTCTLKVTSSLVEYSGK